MKRLAKIFAYLLIILSVLFVIIYFGSDPFLKRMINEKLFEKRIAGIYKVQVEHAHIDLWNMGVSIKGIELVPDSSENVQHLYQYQKSIANIHIKRLTVAHIDLFKWFQDKKIDISKIIIAHPKIKLVKNTLFSGPLPDSLKQPQDSSALINGISLDLLKVKNLSIDYYLFNNISPDLSIHSINLELDNPVVDLQQIHHIDKALLVKKIELEVNGILFKDQKGLYDISLKQITFEDSASTIHLKDFKIKPLLSKEKFAAIHPYQSDRFDGKVKEIIISNLDIDRLLSEEVIAIEKIQISDADMELFRDKNRPFNYNNFPKLPQEALRNLKQVIEIDEIAIVSSNVIYSETAIGAEVAGKVAFKNIQAKVENMGNSNEWQKSKSMVISVQAKAFGKGPLNAHFYFPLNSDTFQFNGKLGKTKMSAFNDMTIHGAGIKITDGSIKEMSFDITADNQSSQGSLELYYDDLEVSILKEKQEEGQTIEKERKFFNFLANKVVLPVQNPSKKGSFYSATVAFDRDINKSIFNYLWKSIFSGIKDTFLKGHKTESINKQVEDGKEDNLSKKDKRRLAREEKKKKSESQ